MRKITIILGTETMATKARRLFAKRDIPSDAVKIDDQDGSGCVHGIEIPYSLFIEAVSALRGAGMNYSVRSI